MRRSTFGLAASGVALCLGCGAPAALPSLAAGPREDPEQWCAAAQDQLDPFVAHWDPTEQSHFARLAREGLVAVKYTGCGLEWIPGCALEGAYQFHAAPRGALRERARERGEAFVKFPLVAARFDAHLGSERGLDLWYAVVTTQAMVGYKRPAVPEECAGATHFVRSADLGAYLVGRYEQTEASASVDVAVGGGGYSAYSKQDRVNTGGDIARAAAGECPSDDAVNCRSVVRLHLEPLEATAANCQPGMTFVRAGAFFSTTTGRMEQIASFCIDRTEVSELDYDACAKAGACRAAVASATAAAAPSDRPVVNVDWADAGKYCGWAKKRMVRESEWEYAATGGDGRSFPWGEDIDCSRANYAECAVGKAMPVASYDPAGASPFGVLNLAGNVWEWVSDARGIAEGMRIVRGGAWGAEGALARTTQRLTAAPTDRDAQTGFRCALTPPK